MIRESRKVMQPKVKDALNHVLEPGEDPIIVFQTAWKPKFGTPTLWCAVTNLRLVLFSSLRRGSVFRAAGFQEINSIAAENDKRIKILFWDAASPDVDFLVADSVSRETVAQFIREVTVRLTRTPAKPSPFSS